MEDLKKDDHAMRYTADMAKNHNKNLPSIQERKAGEWNTTDMIKQRTKIKVLMVLFCCMSTGALHMEMVSKPSTAAFLLFKGSDNEQKSHTFGA